MATPIAIEDDLVRQLRVEARIKNGSSRSFHLELEEAVRLHIDRLRAAKCGPANSRDDQKA